MYRTMCVTLAVVTVGVFVSEIPAQQSGGIKLGEKIEGELTKSAKYISQNKANGYVKGYNAEVPVFLKAGQGISISVTVVGNGRKVGLFLVDPNGDPLTVKLKGMQEKISQLTVDEVNVTGKYTIILASDRIGLFTLRAIDPSASLDGNVEALEARIKRLESELADARAKLKALKVKSIAK